MSRCIIHIGMHKTGTSSIQQSLNGLANETYVYANIDGHPNHSSALAKLFTEHQDVKIKDLNERSVLNGLGSNVNFDGFGALDRMIEEADGRDLLLSGEGIAFFSKNALEKFRKYFSSRFDDLNIVAAVRAPAGYMASAFQEPIKRGGLNYQNFAKRYRSYKKTFKKFDEVFGRQNVQLWKFDPLSFPNGCAVQDFCCRLGIDFPVEQPIIRVNESISREAMGLLFTYRKLGEVLGAMKMTGPQNKLLVRQVMRIGTSKFRFSPDVVRPILDKNRADIEWMEVRLGQSLYENLGKSQPGDVRGEEDLLTSKPETINDLCTMLGNYAPSGVTGQTSNEVALLVHSLRRLSRLERLEITPAGNSRPNHVLVNPQSGSIRKGQKGGDAMKKIYFFVHIPKTAGTSFRKALQQNESVSMIYDYGEKFPESSRELLKIDPLTLTPSNAIFHEQKHNILCGHVNYQRYAHCVSENNIISIVRNPVERIVSEYQHLKRLAGLSISFEEFYSNTIQQDKQWKLLKGLGAEAEVLIGLTSHYKYFVELFSDKFALPIETISINKAPVTDTDDRFSIDAHSIKAAYQLNKKDIIYFFRLARRFAATLDKIGYKTIPKKDAAWNCRIESGTRVVGWFSCRETDCYFVVIKINGENRVIVSLDQYRKDVFAKGLSKSPVCGFTYPLSLLGAEQGDIVSVGILGRPKLERTLTIK